MTLFSLFTAVFIAIVALIFGGLFWLLWKHREDIGVEAYHYLKIKPSANGYKIIEVEQVSGLFIGSQRSEEVVGEAQTIEEARYLVKHLKEPSEKVTVEK